MPVPQFSTLLHWNNIPDLHTSTTNQQFFGFIPSHFSVCFTFDLIAVNIVMSFCVSVQHFAHVSDHSRRRYDVIDFQDGGRCGTVLLPVSDWASHFLQKVNIYQHTKHRQDNSIHAILNSSFGFDFDHITVIRMIFCIK